jgi:hypothetical protein
VAVRNTHLRSRATEQSCESPEEGAILDGMDQVWMRLGDEEQSLLRAEGPRCWPMDPSCWPPPLPEPGISAPRPWTYDQFGSAEEAILDADAA